MLHGQELDTTQHSDSSLASDPGNLLLAGWRGPVPQVMSRRKGI